MRGLEQAAGLSDRRFAYRISSGSVHPNIGGAFIGSSRTAEGVALVLGPSQIGMLEPGVSAALSLAETMHIFSRTIVKMEWLLPEQVARVRAADAAVDELFNDTVSGFKEASAKGL
jgi:hypothetical protein